MLYIPLALLGGIVYAGISNYRKQQRNDKNTSKGLATAQTLDNKLIAQLPDNNEKENERNLTLSASALVMTASGWILSVPLLTWFSVPLIIYLFEPFITRGYNELIKEKRIGVNVLDSTISIAFLGFGYFFASSFFFTFYYISQKLLLKSQDRSKKDVVDVLGKTPRFVWVAKDDVEVKTSFDDLQQGDVIVICPGETIPIDGVIVEGMASIDQHLLTGEFQPVEKEIGNKVYAATIILSGKIYIKLEHSGTATVAAQITEILTNMSDYKTTLQSSGERIADRAALPTLAIAAITLPLLGAVSATATLLAAFGYNMRLVAPINALSFLKAASKDSFLVKDGRIMELLPQVDTIVFDKTGTLTYAQPHVGKIHCLSSYNEDELLYYAAGAEYKQTHPVALAILEETKKRNMSLPTIDDASYEIGFGVKVKLKGKLVQVGSLKFMDMEQIAIPYALKSVQSKCYEHGYSLVYIAIDKKLCGMLELRPSIRHEVQYMIDELHHRGIEIYIISGDQEQPTAHLAHNLGIKHYFAQVLPEEKANIVSSLQSEGKIVCFVGDGINDSIALKTANVSISLHDASAIATDTAQIILLKNNIDKLPHLFDLADQLEQKLKQSLILTVIPGVICVGGVYFFHLGIISAQILYNVGLAMGIGNAMIPLASQNDPEIKLSQTK